ncbi:MAG: hypothetical protein GY859_03515, partial [Desulfobacterales bacterium]|nr:hypothetical protein [Desulfobacterales bacterium]
MGCLFGYYGKPAEGLLSEMADALSHRCKNESERIRLDVGPGAVFELGRGIPPWSDGRHLIAARDAKKAFGYSGVFFNADEIAPPGESTMIDESDERDAIRMKEIILKMASNPGRMLPRLEGAYSAAFVHENGLFLTRDPAGVKALYWTETRDRLLFAS